MTIFFEEGGRVAGEKIVYCFGKVNYHRGSSRVEGTLSLHGSARVLKPLVRSRSHQSRESDEIRCRSARFESDDITENGKVTNGAHRGYQGYLKGDAECVIQIPNENRQ